MSIQITKEVRDEMVAHAIELNPVECCGYLAGTDGKINKIYKMTNTDNSPEHFTFDPKEQFAAVKDARNSGLTLMSVYHSHPETPARLSEEDLKLLNDPSMVYIIVSLAEETPDIKGYKIEKNDDNDISVERVELDIN